MGTLQLKGTLSPDQFWPSGTSDADTARVKVDLKAAAFRFQTDSASPWRTTHVFDTARVVGHGSGNVVSKDGHVTIRLQGIDAPELHYRPVCPKTATPAQRTRFNNFNLDYRQFGGEAATESLRTKLSAGGASDLPCTVQTLVDHPNDVFDIYGRMIGDILVSFKGREMNLNEWVLSEGWALPAFYNSMTLEEIDRLTKLSDQAFLAGKGLWATYSPKVIAVDSRMVMEKPGTAFTAVERRKDLAKGFILPKLFRRLCIYTAEKKASMNQGTFRDFLNNDATSEVSLMSDFSLQGPSASPRFRLGKFLGPQGLTVAPEDLVFVESPAIVKSAAGVIIRDWWS